MLSFLFCCLAATVSAANVIRYTLPNGLTVLLQPDQRAPIVVSMLWYNVGSADEPPGLMGISHALEHTMFKGTTSVPAGQFSRIIAAHGGQENAFTTQDTTAYFEQMGSEHLPLILKLEADRMQHLNLSEMEFEKEKQVIQEERRLRTDNNPQSLTFERFMAAANLAIPYQHPVIGWMNDIKQLQIQDLKNWYRRYYAPNNAVLVLVGDFNPKTATALIKKYFGSIKKSALPTRKKQVEPAPLGTKQITIHAPAQQPMLLLGYTVPSLTSATPEDAYALELLAGVLDAGENARLSKNLIKTKGIASAVNAYYDLYMRYQTQFMLFGIPSPEHPLSDLKQALIEEIKQLKTTLISNQELERIKTQLIAQKTFELDSLFGQASSLGLLESLGLKQETNQIYNDHIRALTPQQLMDTAKHYFCDTCLTEAYLNPLTNKEASHDS